MIFYDASMGSPAISTLTAAIDAGYIQLLGLLTSALVVRKYPPTPTATAKGYLLDLIHQDLQSTTRPPNDQHIEAFLPVVPTGNKVVSTKVVTIGDLTLQNHTDMVGGCFPEPLFSYQFLSSLFVLLLDYLLLL